MAAARTALVRRLLDNRAFHIEFNGYLTNHSKHAVVALAGLGASADRIQAYWEQYTATTPYGLHLDPAQPLTEAAPEITAESLDQYLGAKTEFPALCRFFDAEATRLGLEGAVAAYAPRLTAGSMGALTHAVIHAGWGLDAQHRGMAVEGLAYMAFTFVDAHPDRFAPAAPSSPAGGGDDKATPTPTGGLDGAVAASLLQVADACAAAGVPEWVAGVVASDKYSEAAGFRPELVVTGFQWKLAKVLAEGHPVVYSMPAWLSELPPDAALEQLYRVVVVLYLASAGLPGTPHAGDFLVLHLITSLWALEHLLRGLPDAARRQGMQVFWAGLKALLITSGAGFPPRAQLEGVLHQLAAKEGADEKSKGAGGPEGWATIVPRAIAEKEEHNIKLVYVARELWQRYAHWPAFRLAASLFTDTPSIGPAQAAAGAQATAFSP